MTKNSRFSRRRARNSRVLQVENVVSDASPVATIPQQLTHSFTSSGSYNVPLPSNLAGTPCKVTSVRYQCASAAPCVWTIIMYGPDGASRISRNFVTCGSSVGVHLKNPRYIDVTIPPTAGNGSLVTIMSSGAGTITGNTYYVTASPFINETS